MLRPVSYEQLPDDQLVLLAREDRQAMEAIIARYTGLVWSRVNQYLGYSDLEDLAQEGFLGLLSAVCRYDGGRGAAFSTYAGRCIQNRIISALRRSRKDPMPVGTYDVPPLSQVQDPAEPPDGVVQSRTQMSAMICTMVSRLSRREYQVCILIYSGASYAQAAKALGISEKSVDNALQRARRKLKAGADDVV